MHAPLLSLTHVCYTLLSYAGSFVALYKFILNSLPLILPQPEPKESTSQTEHSLFRQSLKRKANEPPNGDSAFEEIELGIPERARSPRRARLSVNAQAHQVWVRKRTRWWYSAFAGSLAGAIAILFEKRSRRVGIAQQMFVRYVILRWLCSFGLYPDSTFICAVDSRVRLTPCRISMGSRYLMETF